MWVFAPRLSLILQDRDLHFFTQKKNWNSSIFLGEFFSLIEWTCWLMEEECCSSVVRGYQMKPVLLSYSVLWFTADYMGKERFWRRRFCSGVSQAALFSMVVDGLVTLKWQCRVESWSELQKAINNLEIMYQKLVPLNPVKSKPWF